MGYYQSGDYYMGDGAGDPGSALMRRFMPGIGTNIRIAKRVGSAMLGPVVRGAARMIRGRRPARRRLIGRMGRRYRRMNVLNPRALRRALRRARGFEHFARGVISITRPKAGRRWKFQRRRRQPRMK